MKPSRAFLELLKELAFWTVVVVFLALTLPYASHVMFGGTP